MKLHARTKQILLEQDVVADLVVDLAKRLLVGRILSARVRGERRTHQGAGVRPVSQIKPVGAEPICDVERPSDIDFLALLRT